MKARIPFALIAVAAVAAQLIQTPPTEIRSAELRAERREAVVSFIPFYAWGRGSRL